MSNDVYHYGVKNMKWGVRKKRPKSTRRRKVTKTNGQRIFESLKNRNQNKQPKESTSRRTISSMSDEELKAVTTRLQLEKTYRQLTAKEVSKGRKFVNDVLYSSAKATATTYTTKAMTKAVEKLLSDRPRS